MFSNDLVLRLAVLLNLYFVLLTFFNIRFLHRHSHSSLAAQDPGASPKVSVILPVRNEEDRLAACLDSLLAQQYPSLEIVAIDDNSVDGTAAILAGYARRDDRLVVITGEPLPPGWSGKSFACDQGIRAASGDYLLFTDADTLHGPESIAWAVRTVREQQADFLSAYVRQTLGSIGELVVVPTMYVMTALLLPLGLIPRKNSSLFTFAVGQFMICRAQALRSVGGYERFRGSVVEDIAMARELKRSGFKTIFLDAQGYVSCRMYSGLRTAMRGIGKSLFGAINSSLILLGALMCVIFIAIEYPFYSTMTGVLAGSPLLAARDIPVLLFLLAWFMKLHDRKVPVLAVVLYPFTFFVLILVGLYSAVMTGLGIGIEWKGRLVTASSGAVADRRISERSEPPEEVRIADFRPLYRLIADAVFLATLFLVFVFSKIVFGLVVEGRENLELRNRRPVLLVSNHLLYLDAAMAACAIFPRRTFFSALERTFSMPFVGRYIRLLGAFPLPEEDPLRRIAGPLARMFAMGWFVHFFPEGELHLRSREIGDFKLGAFLLATIHDAAVIPVTFVLLPRPLLNILFPAAVRVRIVIQEALDPRDYLARYARRSTAIRAMAEEARSSMMRVIDSEQASFA